MSRGLTVQVTLPAGSTARSVAGPYLGGTVMHCTDVCDHVFYYSPLPSSHFSHCSPKQDCIVALSTGLSLRSKVSFSSTEEALRSRQFTARQQPVVNGTVPEVPIRFYVSLQVSSRAFREGERCPTCISTSLSLRLRGVHQTRTSIDAREVISMDVVM